VHWKDQNIFGSAEQARETRGELTARDEPPYGSCG
jgi:hypothetical protein